MKFLVIIIGIIILGVGGYAIANTLDSVEKSAETNTIPENDHTMHQDHAASVKDDKSFIQGMIPHHEEAVIASKEIVTVAEKQEIKDLAQAIIIAQEKEITEMKTWYEAWFNEPYKDDGKYQPMMKSIEGKNAQQAEAQYLTDMIEHHKAAVTMAETIIPITNRSEITALSQNIIKTQNQEIARMQLLLAEDKADIINDIHSGH